MAEQRQCTATTRKGAPCKARPLHDRAVCMAHSDPVTRASAGFTPEAGKLGGRPPKPTPADFLREWWDANEGKLLDVLTDALEAERAVVVGNGPSAFVEMVPDVDTRLKAFREALDRYFGRPRQAVEVSASDGGGFGAALIMDPELQEAARELLHRAAQSVGEDESGGAGGSDQ